MWEEQETFIVQAFYPSFNLELREDLTIELREDISSELRE